ncbi:MAG: hypothetical protein Ct9H300mP1_27640 [Planctomycetaceae bacterium]|nr:MAG: hypothetical protein Ct9H300mP1_27640 [Planctomycetaceae bacterium]
MVPGHCPAGVQRSDASRPAAAGLSPSYSDGVLVCPTEAGLVVGVDVARRQLLWSYSYRPTHKRLNYSRQQAMRRVLISNRIPKTVTQRRLV